MPFSTCPGQWLPSSLGKAFQVMNLPESCWKLSFAIGVVEAIHSFWGDSVCCFRARSIGLLAKTMKQEEIRSSLSTMDSWVKTGCSCEWIPPIFVEPFRSDCWPTRNSAPTQASCLQSGLLVLSKRPKSVRSWAGTEKLRTAGKAFLLEGHPLNKTLCAERHFSKSECFSVQWRMPLEEILTVSAMREILWTLCKIIWSYACCRWWSSSLGIFIMRSGRGGAGHSFQKWSHFPMLQFISHQSSKMVCRILTFTGHHRECLFLLVGFWLHSRVTGSWVPHRKLETSYSWRQIVRFITATVSDVSWLLANYHG